MSSAANKTQATAIYQGDRVMVIDALQNYKGHNEYLIIVDGEPIWVMGHELTNIVWVI